MTILQYRLRRCPFDGNSELMIARGWHDAEPTRRIFQVFCRECEARGPWKKTEEAAADAWNSRPAHGEDWAT